VVDGLRAPEEVADLIPVKDRVAGIHRLIRTGGSCKRIDATCGAAADYASPGDKETARSPCFRRWELYTLVMSLPPDEMLRLDAKELRSIVKLDDDLISTIANRIEIEQELEIARILAEQKREQPFTLYLDEALALKAVKQYHLDSAVESIDPERWPGLLVSVVLDPRYKIATRMEALDRLSTSDFDQDRLALIIRPLLADPSLELAAQVARITGTSLERPLTTDPALFMRVLAVFLASNQMDSELVRSFAPGGLQIISPAGELVDSIGVPGDDSGYSDDLVTAIRDRLRFQSPLFSRDAKGYVILTGFIDTPGPPETPDACDGDGLEMEIP